MVQQQIVIQVMVMGIHPIAGLIQPLVLMEQKQDL
jgi:hypothetical protein